MRHVLRFIKNKRHKLSTWAVWEETETGRGGKGLSRTVLLLLGNNFGELGNFFFQESTSEGSLDLSAGLFLRHDWGQSETCAGHGVLKFWLRRHRRHRRLRLPWWQRCSSPRLKKSHQKNPSNAFRKYFYCLLSVSMTGAG